MSAEFKLIQNQKMHPFQGRGPVESFTLANSADVLFHRPKGLVGANCFIWFKVGSRNETKEEEGLAHLVEHLIFQKQSQRINDCIRKIESFGADINACTTKEYVCYELSSVSHELDKVLASFLEMVFFPDFENWDVEKELKVIAEELREDLSDPEVVLGEKVFEKSFDYPLGHGVGGRISNLKYLSKEKAIKFYKKYFGLNNATICLVADKPSRLYRSIIEKCLSNANTFLGKSYSFKTRNLAKIEPFKIALKKDVDGCFISYIWPAHPIKGKFHLEFVLLDHMLCSGLGSILFEELRTKHGLIYSVSSQRHCFSDNGLYEIELFCQYTNRKRVKMLFSKLWKKLTDDIYLNEKNLEKAKNQVLGSWNLDLDDIDIRNSYLARGLMFRKKVKGFDELSKELRAINLYDIEKLLKWLGPVPLGVAEILPKKGSSHA